MACDYAGRAELSGYADGELTVERARWWDEHVTGCASCREELVRLQTMRASLRRHLPQREPSSSFREALRERLRAEQGGASQSFVVRQLWQLGLAASLLFVVGIGVGHVATGGERAAIADEVVAAHVRSLAVDHLVDVASSEHHVVKPWFAGKLDFSPPVPELGADGYELSGGRLEYLGGREVAVLVYTRGPHRINLLLWPDARRPACARGPVMVRQGFNLAHGRAAGMEMWAVSDLNRRELEEFVGRWQRAAGACA